MSYRPIGEITLPVGLPGGAGHPIITSSSELVSIKVQSAVMGAALGAVLGWFAHQMWGRR